MKDNPFTKMAEEREGAVQNLSEELVFLTIVKNTINQETLKIREKVDILLQVVQPLEFLTKLIDDCFQLKYINEESKNQINSMLNLRPTN